MEILFSKEFMTKAGEQFYQEYDDTLYRKFRSVVLYMIDHKTRKLVNLQRWLNDQIDDQFKLDTGILQKASDIVQKTQDYDEIVIKALRTVYNRFDYVSDQELYGVQEKWEDLISAWDCAMGDCETQNVIVFAIARLAGVPANRIKIRAGLVRQNDEYVGHCYVWYLANNGQPYILDTTAYYDSRSITRRSSAAEMYGPRFKPRYGDVWWTVDDRKSFGRFRK